MKLRHSLTGVSSRLTVSLLKVIGYMFDLCFEVKE